MSLAIIAILTLSALHITRGPEVRRERGPVDLLAVIREESQTVN